MSKQEELSQTCTTDLRKEGPLLTQPFLVDIASDAIKGERWRLGTKEYYTAGTLDVRNASTQGIGWGL